MRSSSITSRYRQYMIRAQLLVSMSCATLVGAAGAADLSYLTNLLATTPEGGWVKISQNTFPSAFPPGPTLPAGNPRAVVYAWGSFAWDSTRGDLLLWGGGHANYAGNEMYVFDGGTGLWSRGSLPSRLDANNYVVDSAAPQSSHVYDNNLYLPVNDRFITLGGAAWNSGSNFTTWNGTSAVRSGPWVWDPSKADANRVGGTTGSGYNVATLGGNMWTNLAATSTGPIPANFVESATAYRTEFGKDVVYASAPLGTGFAGLYRYEIGDVANGGANLWQKVGVQNSGGYTFQHAATIDTTRGLYIFTDYEEGNLTKPDLSVYDLSKNNAANPNLNSDVGVRLFYPDGSPFVMNKRFGIAFDSDSGVVTLWDRSDGGSVWYTTPTVDGLGNISTTWTVTKVLSTTTAKPTAGLGAGVLGKWQYVEELGAFIALDDYDFTAQDAGVWLYKPLAAVVPEPPRWLLAVLGLAMVAWYVGRRRRDTWF